MAQIRVDLTIAYGESLETAISITGDITAAPSEVYLAEFIERAARAAKVMMIPGVVVPDSPAGIDDV